LEEKPQSTQINKDILAEFNDSLGVILNQENKSTAQHKTEETSVGTDDAVLTNTAQIVDPGNSAAELDQTKNAGIRNNETTQPEPTDTAAGNVDDSSGKGVVASAENPNVIEKTIEHELGAPGEAKRAIVDTNTGWWGTVAYGSIVGLFVALTVSVAGFYTRWQSQSVSNTPVMPERTGLTEAPVKTATPVKTAIVNVLSPEEALEKIDAVRRSLLLELTSSPTLVPRPMPFIEGTKRSGLMASMQR
jgi:hypothetical protein